MTVQRSIAQVLSDLRMPVDEQSAASAARELERELRHEESVTEAAGHRAADLQARARGGDAPRP